MRRELYARDQVVLVRHKKRRASLLPRQIGVNDHRKWPDLHQNTARAIMNVETSPGMGGVGCAHILKILISRQSNVKHTSYSYTWCLRCFRLHLEICGSKNPRRYGPIRWPGPRPFTMCDPAAQHATPLFSKPSSILGNGTIIAHDCFTCSSYICEDEYHNPSSSGFRSHFDGVHCSCLERSLLPASVIVVKES
jgi:hypothetical protein